MSAGKKVARLSFEESLAQIEKIIAMLESGNLSLEESLAQFESGIKLVRQCHQNLEQAEQKIELILNTGEGLKISEAKITEDGVCL
jgi:exodeoxyribonuclease VII small subunit